MWNDELKAGERIADRYRVEGVLGSGGMSRVYRAHDERLDRVVAIKVLQGALAGHAARFEREARAAAGLRHPSVVRVYDFGGLEDGRHFLVLELVEGRTLREVLVEQGRMGARRAVHLLLPIAGALAEAHAAGIIHRDLKPENLMWQRSPGLPEWLRLLDFGIASMAPAEGEARLTHTGEVFGTPEFMAPEQALGRAVSPATDVWALGCVLHTVLAGTAPFRGTSAPEILLKIVKDAPPPLPEDVPAPYRELVAACLAKEAASRPADGAALVRVMESLVAPVAEVVGGTPPTAPRRTLFPSLRTLGTLLPGDPKARRPALTGFGAGAALAAGIVVLAAGRGGPEEVQEAPPIESPPAAEAPPSVASGGALAPAEKLLADGQAKAALAWLEANEGEGAPADRLLVRGLARLGAGEVKNGVADVAAALASEAGLAGDPRLVPALLAQLDHRDAEGAVALLAGPLAPHAGAALLERAGGGGYRARWRAVEAIEKGGGDARAAKLAALRRDLRLDDCDARRATIRKLAQLGDPAAIPDIQRADQRPFLDNLCMGDTIPDALRTLRAAAKGG